MDIPSETMESSSKDSSNSYDAKRESLKIAPLLKSVPNSISNRFGLKWYLINVDNFRPRRKRRYFINLSRFSTQLPSVISSTLHLLKYPNWSAIFLATTPHSFMYYQAHFPMTSIVTFSPTSKAISKQKSGSKKLRGLLPSKINKIKDVKAIKL
ncbi:uncharacterized protein LOC122618205 [Drosophila teissieri]|uniref:uncharacterized protein LOC122618205 n=1 Tax=Drosophila teissieri TaxID=7243 RepID=UPI001CBA28BC|nr:uncharacterized protein LOC122618205 [Drosophila teissieri]XP_043650374.1 uncharacterized protein LOC122618205 [Drosophila teissieri]